MGVLVNSCIRELDIIGIRRKGKSCATRPQENGKHAVRVRVDQGQVDQWIRLTSKTQRVQINGEKSEWGNVTSGVPQGSVLGLLLFVNYIKDINGLETGISSDISKFADDTKIGRPIGNIGDTRRLHTRGLK